MNTVTTVNLNGKAYKLEEAGAEALRAYLDQAATRLADDPDKEEILKDFEQAIAEKFDSHITAHKNVITTEIVTKSIEEMGPVHAEGTDTPAPGSDTDTKGTGTAKRLYRIREGEKLWGVCTGIAAYFDIDVTIVRVAFVVLALISHGAGVGLYIVLAIIVPVATTSEEKATARGENFNAHEFIESLRKKYAKYGEEGYWKDAEKKAERHARRAERHFHRWSNHVGKGISSGFSSLTRFAATVVAIAGAIVLGILSVASIATLWSTLSTGLFFGYTVLYGVSPILMTIFVLAASFVLFWPVFMVTKEARRIAYPAQEEPRDIHDIVVGAGFWGVAIAVTIIVFALSFPRFQSQRNPYGFRFHVKHREVCVGGNNYCTIQNPAAPTAPLPPAPAEIITSGT